VAVAVYFTFIAQALHEHPELRARLASQANGFTDHFVQEVRRFYPFFPAVAARVREGFDWQGYRFPAGMRVLLDLYGTNHDERLWDSPQRFKPDRFARRQRTAFDFIPQGGGDHATGHRCPGEAVTVELMKTATRFLTRDLEYQIPPQDLTIDFTRLPALPRSHVVMEHVKLLGVPVDAD
jgi:fatty-acid peroxygenase